MAQRQTLPGLLQSRYRVLARLPDDDTTEVFLMQDDLLGRRVAMHRIRVELRDDPGRRADFFERARAAASLNLPGVCGVLDVGEDAGEAYAIESHGDGTTLAEIAASRRRELDWSAQVAQQLAALFESVAGGADLSQVGRWRSPDQRVRRRRDPRPGERPPTGVDARAAGPQAAGEPASPAVHR